MQPSNSRQGAVPFQAQPVAQLTERPRGTAHTARSDPTLSHLMAVTHEVLKFCSVRTRSCVQYECMILDDTEIRKAGDGLRNLKQHYGKSRRDDCRALLFNTTVCLNICKIYASSFFSYYVLVLRIRWCPVGASTGQ